MENFRIAVNAVMPFMICIAFGYAVRRLRLADRAFMQSLNQLVFKVFFPFMMFYNMYDNGDSLEMNARLLAVSVCSLFLLIAVLFVIVPLLVRDNPKRGVVIQGIYRSNFVLFAIPLTENLFGREGVAMASLLVAVIVPLYNVMAVIILEYFRGGSISIVTLAGKILKNPLILGAIAGLIALVCGICLPQAVEKPVSQFAAMTTPLALFVLGGTLDFSSVRADRKYLVSVLGIKMMLLPAVAAGVSLLADFTELERFLYLIMFAAPIAASSYPMAQNMGGDGKLAGELVVISTAVSVGTIFFWIYVMKAAGLI